MKSKFIYACFLAAGIHQCYAQITTNVAITDDATINMRAGTGNEYIANTNYGSSQTAFSQAWTNSGNGNYLRYIFEVDLSDIPSGAQILEADLFLFSDGNHYPLSGDNDSWLHEVTGSWTESTVTWNNQPTYTVKGSDPYLPASDTSGANVTGLDYIVDIQNMVAKYIDSNQTSMSLLMKLDNETYYRRLRFRSSDYAADSTKRPYVSITYVVPNYAVLKDKLDGSFYTCTQGQLKLLFTENYYSELLANNLDLKIYDSSNSLVYNNTSRKTKTGVLRVDVDLKATGNFTNNEFYDLVVTDRKGNSKYLRLKYQD